MANFATLDSIRKAAEDDEKKDSGNTYYAGGAGGGQGRGGSGLSIIGGPDEGRGEGAGGGPGAEAAPSDLRESIIRRAHVQAQEAGSDEEVPPTNGRRIVMWRNGFTVDDGPFRSLQDEANAPFLRDLANGMVPRELEEGVTGKGVSLTLVDKQGEDYEAPAYIAFGGGGQTMGTSAVDQAAVVSATAGAEVAVPEVDASQPSTTLQVRLHDGRRVRAQLNMHHTVQHVQAIIRREGAGDQAYVLMAGFPPAALTDATLTLEQAGLKGASITQKLC